MRKQKSLIVLLVGGFLIFTAAAFIFTKYYASRPIQPTPLPATQTVASSPALSTPVSGGFEASANPEIPRVSLEDAKAAFDSRSAVFIDVRGSAAFAFSHIPGALDIPLSEIETRLTELDPSQWIITYCT